MLFSSRTRPISIAALGAWLILTAGLTLAAAASADTGAPRTAFLQQAIAAGESMTRADSALADSGVTLEWEIQRVGVSGDA